MTRRSIITICASASHYLEVIQIEKELKTLEFRVKIPKTANIMKRKNDFEVSHYKTWLTDKEDYRRKTNLMLEHFKKVKEADAILVVNLEKYGIGGYIGGNVLMEMLVAFLNKKRIYLYNEPAEELTIYEEILGLLPTIIYRDLSRIK